MTRVRQAVADDIPELGQVFGVVTDPAHRRRGHSRAIMNGLLDWFSDREVARVDLHASTDGEPLYRALGFVDHPEPALYWRPQRRNA